MKRIFFLSFVLSMCVCFGSAAEADTITIRADAWPPYNADPKSDMPGYGIEILKAIFEKQGHTIDYQTIPWNRALADVKAGKFDGAIGASAEDGEGCLFPTESLGVMATDVFVKKDNPWKYDGKIESLKSVKLGVIDGYDYGSTELNDYIEQNKTQPIVQVTTGDDALDKNISKALAGRIDVVVESPLVMLFTLKRMNQPTDAFVSAGEVAPPTPIFVVFSPAKESSKKYAQIFDDGMKELRTSEGLKKILDRYGLKDWK